MHCFLRSRNTSLAAVSVGDFNRRSCATCRRCTRWRNAGVLHGHSLCRRRRLWRCLRGTCLSSTFVTLACQSFHSLSTSPVVSAECRPDCCKSCENELELILERARLDLQISFLWGLEEVFGREDSISSWSDSVDVFCRERVAWLDWQIFWC